MTSSPSAAGRGNPLELDAFPSADREIPEFLTGLGFDLGAGEGILDIHVHGLPEPLQRAVWAYFDRLDQPPWPIAYRDDEDTRLSTLRDIGIVRHTALAYAHREGVASWCNDHTLGMAQRHDQVVPTFTFHPEPEVEQYVQTALDAGGQVAKVHLQVGRFDPLDPRLAEVWTELERRRVLVVLHASAVYGVDGGEAWCGPDPVRRLLDRHPDLEVCIAHLGWPDQDAFLDLAADGAIWLDHSMVLMDPTYFGTLPRASIERTAELHERLLFGTDFPSIPHPVAAQLRGLADLQLDRASLRALLHDRAAGLLARSRPDLG